MSHKLENKNRKKPQNKCNIFKPSPFFQWNHHSKRNCPIPGYQSWRYNHNTV